MVYLWKYEAFKKGDTPVTLKKERTSSVHKIKQVFCQQRWCSCFASLLTPYISLTSVDILLIVQPNVRCNDSTTSSVHKTNRTRPNARAASTPTAMLLSPSTSTSVCSRDEISRTLMKWGVLCWSPLIVLCTCAHSQPRTCLCNCVAYMCVRLNVANETKMPT